MSFKARRVADSGSVVSFAWDGHTKARLPVPEPVQEPVAASEDAVEPQAPAIQIEAIEREAFARGYQEGERAGFEAGGQVANQTIERLTQAIEEISTARMQMIRQTERQMVELALAIARRIIHREVSLDRDLLVAMARVALDRLGETNKITIHLHPDEYDITQAGRISTLMGTSVMILADPRLDRGACLVESELGTLDVSVDAQIEEVARALLGVRRRADEERDDREPMSDAA
jgi:flagellar assembly protein FliH